jgi:outer membrane protein TolC
MIHWTFPNVVIALAQVKGQEANAHAALAMYDQTVLTALKEADSALDSYARALEHDAALRQTRDTDREAYAQVQRLYLRGSSPYLDVLTAQQTLIDVEQQLVSSNATVSSDQVQVFQALGGGWGGSAQQAALDAQAQATAAAQRYQAVAVKAAQERGR